MEQALYITKLRNIHYLRPGFTRLYYGAEFCQRLLPDAEDLQCVIDIVRAQGLALTLMTPYVTNEGIDRISALLGLLQDSGVAPEVVFNDWGVLQLLRHDFVEYEPVMGRLLNKTKRGPRIINIIDKVPPATGKYYQSSNLNVPAACTFLKQRGVRRVEFDNQLQGIQLDDTDRDLKKTLYMPYVFVSTTRFCLSANCDDPAQMDYVGVSACGRQCRDYVFQLDNPVMRVPLLRKGNAMFYVNEQIPDAVTSKLVDRIVVQPEIPA